MRSVPIVRVLTVCALLVACKKSDEEPAAPSSASAAPPPAPAASSARPAASSAPPAASSAPADATSAPAPDKPFAPGEVWNGSYSCRGNGGATSLQLRFDPDPAKYLHAVFSFSTRAKKSGAYNMSGTYDAATRKLHLTPGSWINRPPNFTALSMDGALSADGASLAGSVAGVAGCTSFSVKKAEAAPPTKAEAAPQQAHGAR